MLSEQEIVLEREDKEEIESWQTRNSTKVLTEITPCFNGGYSECKVYCQWYANFVAKWKQDKSRYLQK